MNRLIVTQKLRGLLSHPPRSLRYLPAGFAAPPGALFVPWPRLNTVLSGRMTLEYGARDGATTEIIAPGDAFFAEANAWEKITWSGPFELLCIVPRTRYLRLAYYRVPASYRGPQPEPEYRHTDRPYEALLRGTVDLFGAALECRDLATGLDLARVLPRLALAEMERPSSPPRGKSNVTFGRVQSWLENSFHGAVTREQTARRFSLTPSYLSRLYQRMTGESFQIHLRRLRMDQARALLKSTDLTVAQVGLQCGYPDPVHFVRRFRETLGMTPGRYRAENQ